MSFPEEPDPEILHNGNTIEELTTIADQIKNHFTKSSYEDFFSPRANLIINIINLTLKNRQILESTLIEKGYDLSYINNDNLLTIIYNNSIFT